MANGTWKIARRGNAQLPLVIVLALAVVLVLLGKAQSGLFDRARAALTDWMAPAAGQWCMRRSAASTAGSARSDELFTVYQENLRLKDENARLRQWRNVAVVLQDRVRRYQLLLHAVPDPELNSVLARVIGRASRPFLETMILDAGAANNVKPGQAVVDARGMIGRIYLAGSHTSWVILLTDLNSRIPGHHRARQPSRRSWRATTRAMPTLDTLSQIVTAAERATRWCRRAMAACCRPAFPSAPWWQQGGRYRVALLADAAASEDVEVLAFRKPPEALPAAVAAASRRRPRVCRRRRRRRRRPPIRAPCRRAGTAAAASPPPPSRRRNRSASPARSAPTKIDERRMGDRRTHAVR